MASNSWDNEKNELNKHTAILKDCPFCGCNTPKAEDTELEFIIECPECKVSMYRCEGDFVNSCIEAWNRRAWL